MKNIIQLLVVGLLVFLAYKYYAQRKAAILPDVSKYENAIDSLQKEIVLDKQKLATYDSVVVQQNKKITTLKNKLSSTAAEAAKSQKQHEEDIKRINSMSNNDIVTAFTETFK